MLNFLILSIIIAGTIYVGYLDNVIAARAGFLDDKDDWSEFKVSLDYTGYDYRITLGDETRCEEQIPRKDITSATFTLENNHLNGTIWLEDTFQSTPPAILKGIIYTMSIVELSTTPNPIYTVANSWDAQHNWSRIIYEHSLSNVSRIVENSSNFVGFGNTTSIPGHNAPKSYVDFYLDAHKLILPDNYLVVFSVVEFSNKCFILDGVDESLAAESVLNVSSTPRIELRPGEEKTVELTLISSLQLDNVKIAAGEPREVSLNFVNDTLSTDSSGRAFPVSVIKVAPDASPREYSIPFILNVSLPETVIYPAIFLDILEAERGLHMSVEFVDYLKVNVLPAYSPLEQLNLIFQGNAGILGFAALLLSGVGIFYTNRKVKRKK